MAIPASIKIILTGATGMVGEVVLHECLIDDEISEVLVINRKHAGIIHPKLKEIIHDNFFDLSPVADRLIGYDSCLFCLGVSSVGMSEEKFNHLTYDLTMHFAKTLSEKNPQMIFCYISGVGTDSSEKGKIMWARVKGKTENDLLKLPFRKAYMFRPSYLQPMKNMKLTHKYYKWISWMYPFLKAVAPKYMSTLQQLARAMICVSKHAYDKRIIEVPEINSLAECK